MEYSYDDTGYTLFFLFTFLSIILLPTTWSSLKSRKSLAAPAPCAGWNQKNSQVKRAKSKTSGVSKKLVFLSLGWLLLALIAHRITQFKPEQRHYDPFEILGISSSTDEKAIKRHYKRLSIKFHPDKLVLAENQTKEEADSHFVELTKAYKALTDETIRQNYEQYGHPDGKQEMSMGIALPKWVVESRNNVYVLGGYAIVFGILLPWLVGSWWYGSRAVTKDQISVKTMGTYFRSLEEDVKFSKLIEILCSAEEFEDIFAKHKRGSTKEFNALDGVVKGKLAELGERLEGQGFRRKSAKRSGVLIYSYLFRLDVQDLNLLRERQAVVSAAHHLSTGLINISLAYNWFSTYLLISSLQQLLIQALHPSSPLLLQLPNITQDVAEKLAKDYKVTALDDLVRISEAKIRPKDWPELPSEAKLVAENLPQLELLSARFNVAGESIITPGSFVQLVLRLRIRSPGQEAKDTFEEIEEEDDDNVTSKGTDEGAVPLPHVNAPWFPKDRKPQWAALLGDVKANRIWNFNKFTDVGRDRIRVIRTTFQAPPEPRLYPLRLFLKNDSYVGLDVATDMKLLVQPPTALGAAAQPEEDEISEPDEDTLEGQMAAMKGQPVKRTPAEEGEEDEDEESSGTEEEEEDDSDSSSSSDDSD